MRLRSWCAALGFLTALGSTGSAQQPILAIRVPGVGQTLVQARLDGDGVLLLPTEPIEGLTGEEVGEDAYLSLASLRTVLGPAVDIDYDSRRAVLRIRDPMGRLAATRALFDRRKAEGEARPVDLLFGGPYAALTTEVGGGTLVEGGWNFGPLAVGAARSTQSGLRWNASLRVLRQAYLTYVDTDDRGPSFGARWAAGPTFVGTSYTPGAGDLRVRAATSVGPWTFYVQDDGTASVSHRSVVQVTMGQTSDGFVTRLSYGRHPSPLAVPRVR